MSDDELHESPLSPADDERIRRLLAEARHTEPIPESVAARLDKVLTGLSLERTERAAEPVAAVVDLAARRRRTAANLLVAAAAVLVVGFGVSQVLPDLNGGSDAGTTAATDQQESAGGGAGMSDGDSRVADPVAPAEGESADIPAFQVRSKSFGADARRVRDRVVVKGSAAFVEYPAASCVPADAAANEVVAVRYDGTPAALVLRPPAGDVQVVDLYLCGDAVPRRSITLTAP